MTKHELAVIAASLAASIALHAGAAAALGRFRLHRAPDAFVDFEVKAQAPAQPPPPPPAAVEEKPKIVRKVAKTPPLDLAPPKKDEPQHAEEKPVPRVFGAKLEGASNGEGVAVPEGNTLGADPNRPRPKEVPRSPPTTGAPAPPGEVTGFVPADDSQIADFPEVAEEVKAPYPPAAEARQIQGTVQVRVEVNADGSVHGARVLKGLGFGLDEAAVSALHKFRFKPARDRAGRAVPSVIVWRYTFQLDR